MPITGEWINKQRHSHTEYYVIFYCSVDVSYNIVQVKYMAMREEARPKRLHTA